VDWCRVVIAGADGRVVARCAVSGDGDPGLGAVDLVAVLALLASRMGGKVTMTDVAPRMGELLELAGLGIETSGLRVEVDREAEGGEESLVVERGQEEVHRRDAPA